MPSELGKSLNWTPEGGYAEDIADKLITPKTAAGNFFPFFFPNLMNVLYWSILCSGPGKNMGLFVVLNASVADYYCSSTNSAGFKMLLHSPIETPNIADYGIALMPGLETRIIINPRFSEASDRLRSVPIKHRQCIFANEKRLSYFKWVWPLAIPNKTENTRKFKFSLRLILERTQR